MISTHELIAPPEVIHFFLTTEERQELRALWWAVKARSTANLRGYAYVELYEHEYPRRLVEHAFIALGYPMGEPMDSFFIHHDDGASTAQHTDHNRRRRLNALVIAPTRGGIFNVNGALIALEERDAVLFQPSQPHHLTPVIGERLVWSVGIHPR